MSPTPEQAPESTIRLRQGDAKFWLLGGFVGLMGAFALLIACYGFFLADPEDQSTPVAIGTLVTAIVFFFMFWALRRTGYDLDGDTLFRCNGFTSHRTHVTTAAHIRSADDQTSSVSGAAIPARTMFTQLVIWTDDPKRPKSRMHHVMSGGDRGRVAPDDGSGASPVILATDLLRTRDRTTLHEWFRSHGLQPTSDQAYPLVRL